jgi:probable rRNA maturation factor
MNPDKRPHPRPSLASGRGEINKRINLSVQYASRADEIPARAEIRAWSRAALNVDGKRGAQITIRFVDADEGQALNRDYRGKDTPTNVLSFVYESEPLVQGDLVICAPVVTREAGEQGKTRQAHYAHLIVHGLLHLLGYDHETSEDDARQMEDKERAILASLGFADPYTYVAMADESEVTDQVVYQRIRNRVIEVLDWIIECETMPPNLGMGELINCWYDWVPGPLTTDYFPVFVSTEELLLRNVSTAMDSFCDVTPKLITDELSVLSTPQWAAVVATAKIAFNEMMKRGRMSEDEEIAFPPNTSS